MQTSVIVESVPVLISDLSIAINDIDKSLVEINVGIKEQSKLITVYVENRCESFKEKMKTGIDRYNALIRKDISNTGRWDKFVRGPHAREPDQLEESVVKKSLTELKSVNYEFGIYSNERSSPGIYTVQNIRRFIKPEIVRMEINISYIGPKYKEYSECFFIVAVFETNDFEVYGTIHRLEREAYNMACRKSKYECLRSKLNQVVAYHGKRPAVKTVDLSIEELKLINNI